MKMPSWFIWIALIASIYLLTKLGRFWYADTLFAAGYRLNRSGSYQKAQQFLSRAVAINAGEPLYHDELASALASLTVETAQRQEATAAAALAQQSLKESDRALMISPHNVNFWKTRTKLYYAFSSFDTHFNEAAITTLERALALSPHDPKIVYNLAILYGRAGNNQKAIEMLKQTITLKPNYRDAYYALSIFYRETNQPALAKAILKEYLTKVDPHDTDFQDRLK